MVATTWVQITKAFLLLIGGTIVALLAFSKFDFDFETLVSKAMEIHRSGAALLMPGKLLGDPVAAISLSLGLIFGTAGMPHILMRFFTVKDAKEARKSVLYASGFIGYFFNVLLILGLASIVIVSQDLRFFEAGDINGKLLGGGNMVAMHLAHAVGGDLMFGFLAAITFATILAVVSGLALAGASAIARDFYVHVICRGVADEAKELRLTKFATLALGVVAILLGIVFQKVNVAFMVAIAFGVAASANFPVLFLSMFWRGLTTRGALAGGYTGLVSAVALVCASKSVWVNVLGYADALFPYEQPALFSMPLAFAVAIVVSLLDRSEAAASERARFFDLYVRSQTGVGVSAPLRTSAGSRSPSPTLARAGGSEGDRFDRSRGVSIAWRFCLHPSLSRRSGGRVNPTRPPLRPGPARAPTTMSSDRPPAPPAAWPRSALATRRRPAPVRPPGWPAR